MPRLAEEGSSDKVKNDEVMVMDKEERVSNVGEEDMSVEEVEEVERVSQQKKSKGSGVLTDVPFTSLGLSEPTLKALNERAFHTMTKIQCDAIPPLLNGKDLLGAARTGSGKTLAFLISAAELLHKLNSSSGRETSVIFVCPTRELAIQTHLEAVQLLKYQPSQNCGLIMGQASKTAEKKNLLRGLNLIVATPGRLLNHLQNTVGTTDSTLAALYF